MSEPMRSELREVVNIARRCAFLFQHAADDSANPLRLAEHLELLYGAITEFDSDEPDLTFCCGCLQELVDDQYVLDGAKYHARCLPGPVGSPPVTK